VNINAKMTTTTTTKRTRTTASSKKTPHCSPVEWFWLKRF